MTTSVGTKARKKQSPLSERTAVPEGSRELEQALMALENACFRVLDGRTGDRQDTDQIYWQQILKNIATPISLALAECKGPRHFHYHYCRRADDESIMHPVMESPLDTLAQVCREALNSCRNLVGIQDTSLTNAQHSLENALQTFLLRYKGLKKTA